MDTPRHDIEIHQGATFSLGFAYLDPDNLPINLTGWKARMQVRDRVGGKVLADLSTENGRISIEPATGRVNITLPGSVTRLMAAGRAAYDLFLISADDFSIKLIEGEAMVVASVTRG